MPLFIIRNDITKMNCDAIVNAANPSLLGGGGVDGAIHRAAGRDLFEECRKLGGCKVGSAKITAGYALQCKHIIHAVGPVWKGGNKGEKELLSNCYSVSLSLAVEHGCSSIAFPLISAGAYGYPKELALKVAMETIGQFLDSNDELKVYIVLFERSAVFISEKLFSDITQYIDDEYVNTHFDSQALTKRRMQLIEYDNFENELEFSQCLDSHRCFNDELEKRLSTPDESFSEMLLRLIDQRGIKDSECYKKANVDRKLFSKIRSDRLYRPSKATVVAFAIALELSLRETELLLKSAGFAFSKSSKFDIIIEYFIERGEYDIFEINRTLFTFDQMVLGA